MSDSEWQQAPQIDEMTVDLICWQGWYNSPVSGLARWEGRVVWFQQLDWWEGEGEHDWGYDIGLYVLNDEDLADAVAWFREKERWYFNPELVALREQVADTDVRAALIKERGLTLREWQPALPGRPDAWFRHRLNPAFYGAQSRSMWRLPKDWPA